MLRNPTLGAAIVKAHEGFLRGEPPAQVLSSLLHEIVRLSGCEKGFLAEVPQQLSAKPASFHIHANVNEAWSRELWSVWPPPGRELWFQNQVSGASGVRSWAQLPISDRGHFLGFVGLMNREGGFSAELETTLAPLLNACAVLLRAWQDRRKYENALSQSQNHEEILRMALDGATEGVWDLNFITGKVYLSETWLANFGWKPEEFPDHGSMMKLIHPEDLPRVKRALNNHSEGKTLRFESECRVLRSDGGYVSVLGRGKVVKRDKFGRPQRMVGTTLDLTEYKRVQNDLLDAQKNMVESAKFSALGVMAAGIAHEINNPLAIIQAYSQVLENPAKLTEEKLEKARGAIQRSVDRISKIIRGLRAVARDADGDPFEIVPVQSVLDEILSFSFERILNQGIDFKISCDSQLLISCQPVQLSQVFLDLLNNAVDALEDSPQKWISFEAFEDEERVVILFSDSGSGVATDLRKKIFEPFFTTKEVGRGTGLGLSISRSIIEDHGGRFYLKSEGNPTCFAIELPRAKAEEQHEPRSA